MSKAILVIDMPKSCNEWDVICTKYYSALQNGSLEVLTKPSDCPLKELPHKKVDKIFKVVPTVSSQHTEYAQGYNACIDEIIGGK